MNNPDTDLIFPLRVTPFLINSHDAEWKALVEYISSNEGDIADQFGFVLTMVRLAGCVSCNSDSFRAMRGCTQCALQTIRRQHSSGFELKMMFEQNRAEVEKYLKKRRAEEAQAF